MYSTLDNISVELKMNSVVLHHNDITKHKRRREGGESGRCTVHKKQAGCVTEMDLKVLYAFMLSSKLVVREKGTL